MKYIGYLVGSFRAVFVYRILVSVVTFVPDMSLGFVEETVPSPVFTLMDVS
jgi:hypothetical protein